MNLAAGVLSLIVPDVRSSAATHVGCVRSSNQDAYCAKPAAGVWAVADGMGGHHGGERASALIISAIETLREDLSFEAKLSAVRTAIAEANRAIFAEAQETGRQMGSTVVALVVGEGRYAILWAGDSRAYLRRGDSLRCLTRDHSQAEELVAAGLLDASDVTGHPSSHVLVRAIGVMPNVDLDQIKGKIVHDDMFLLCSDGLHNLVSETELLKIMTSEAFDGVSEQLVLLGLERGAPDNITACLAYMSGGDSVTSASFGHFQQ